MSWTLSYGIHRHTFTSRDMGTPITNLQDLKVCEGQVQVLLREYRNLGCCLWFATATGPDGTQHQLHGHSWDDPCQFNLKVPKRYFNDGDWE